MTGRGGASGTVGGRKEWRASIQQSHHSHGKDNISSMLVIPVPRLPHGWKEGKEGEEAKPLAVERTRKNSRVKHFEDALERAQIRLRVLYSQHHCCRRSEVFRVHGHARQRKKELLHVLQKIFLLVTCPHQV